MLESACFRIPIQERLLVRYGIMQAPLLLVSQLLDSLLHCFKLLGLLFHSSEFQNAEVGQVGEQQETREEHHCNSGHYGVSSLSVAYVEEDTDASRATLVFFSLEEPHSHVVLS